MSKIRFEAQDLRIDLPIPGWYPAQIQDARFCRSACGNRMLQVRFALADVDVSYQRLSEYFVIEGATPFGLVMTRRRLVDLYRATGLDPQPGDEIAARDLVGRALDVELGHDTWQGQPRLKVLRHRPCAEPAADGFHRTVSRVDP